MPQGVLPLRLFSVPVVDFRAVSELVRRGDCLMNDLRPLRPDSTETRSLLQQAQAGDRQAFEDLFARHRPYLRQLVELRLDPKLHTRVDPSDVVQEAHLEAFRRLSTYLKERPMPFRLWLRQIAY